MLSNETEPLRIFTDEKLSADFDIYGYVLLDLLPANKVKQLRDYYLANPNPFRAGFHTTHFTTDKDYKEKVHGAIASSLGPHVRQILPNYIAAFGNFMVKEAGGNNFMPLHADWTYVDETQFRSLSVWMPLIDTNPENGQLGVIPFSQNLSYHVRGPGIKQWMHPAEETLIHKMGKLLSLKAGQAIIYDHRLLHFSLSNNSGLIRPAVNLSLVPKHAPLIHYTVPEGESGVHLYEIDHLDFFIHYDNFKIPERGKLIRVQEEPVPMLNSRIDAFIKKYSNRGILERIMAWF